MEINSHVQFAESTGIEVIEAQDRALIDTQIATAKNIQGCCLGFLIRSRLMQPWIPKRLNCFMHSEEKEEMARRIRLLSGVSVRMAEIIAGAWGILGTDKNYRK